MKQHSEINSWMPAKLGSCYEQEKIAGEDFTQIYKKYNISLTSGFMINAIIIMRIIPHNTCVYSYVSRLV